MLYHALIRRQHGRGDGRAIVFDRPREWIEDRLVGPWNRGEEIIVNGGHWNPRDVQITVVETEEALGSPDGSVTAWSNMVAGGKARSRTDEMFDRPAGIEAVQEEPLEYAEDRRAVMVVSGRDGVNVAALFTLLRAIDLRPLEWSELVGDANSGAPYIGQVLDAAFGRCQAVVVLQTPDDIAYLRSELVPEDDPEGELVPRGQARPNVFFEAGMAIGRFPLRTVLVEVGVLRPASDLAGRHAVRIDDGPEWRSDLARRLERAGCEVNLEGTAWLSAGEFERPLELGEQPAKAEAGNSELMQRIDVFLGELGGEGYASMTMAAMFNRLVDESGVEGIQRAGALSRSMSSVSGMTRGDMRVLLNEVKTQL